MGKFDGILLCTDLDDTLLTTDKRVSDENSKAIEYFKSEGGLFTFATGRVPQGAKLMLTTFTQMHLWFALTVRQYMILTMKNFYGQAHLIKAL